MAERSAPNPSFDSPPGKPPPDQFCGDGEEPPEAHLHLEIPVHRLEVEGGKDDIFLEEIIHVAPRELGGGGELGEQPREFCPLVAKIARVEVPQGRLGRIALLDGAVGRLGGNPAGGETRGDSLAREGLGHEGGVPHRHEPVRHEESGGRRKGVFPHVLRTSLCLTCGKRSARNSACIFSAVSRLPGWPMPTMEPLP